MPTVNVDLGNDCNINPEISYSGDESNLKYEWKIGTYVNGSKGELKTVSTDRNLDYKFLTGGTYYAHLTVTDGSVGKAMDYRINVNRLFEEGLMICSTDPTATATSPLSRRSRRKT